MLRRKRFYKKRKCRVDKQRVFCYNLPCVCGRSSSGRARPCQGRGSEFEPRRPLQKETPSVRMVFSFLEQHFCYAKVVACGRVIEREWGNSSKVPPSHSSFLAMCRGADNKICTQSQKKHYLSGGCFLFGMPRAGLNSLPRPARSALNQEVRQGSCEWLCHSWDAGSESSLVMRTSLPERWST